jgi:hypothetical protein
MPIDFGDDLDEMLSTDDHGVSASYNGSTFEGILNQEYYQQDVGTAGIASSKPVFYTRSSNLVDLEEGEIFSIGDRDYSVAHFEPDGQGLTMVVLNG